MGGIGSVFLVCALLLLRWRQGFLLIRCFAVLPLVFCFGHGLNFGCTKTGNLSGRTLPHRLPNNSIRLKK
jgi:hypothetical protein